MKQVVFIMGTYGSGKSTFYDTLLSDKMVGKDFTHINLATKVKEKLEEVEIKHIAYQLTMDEIKNELETAIENSKNIVIETNFAAAYGFDDVNILDEFKNSGYHVEGYFLYTDNVEKNINNKLISYLRGDSIHIDDDTITKHYYSSLENIEKYSEKFDQFHLIDNSNFKMETKKVLESQKIENLENYFSENKEVESIDKKSFLTNRY